MHACEMTLHQLLLVFCVTVGTALAWNQPSTCYVRQSTCSSDSELRGIKETLISLQTTLASISTSLQELACKSGENTTLNQTDSPSSTTPIPTEPVTTVPSPIGSFYNPATSCRDINQEQPSGEYWIETRGNSSPVQVYCDTNRTSCTCNTTGGWTRVANLDMTDSNQTCPDGFDFEIFNGTEKKLRTCGRHEVGCVSIKYSSYGIEYSHVCGKVIGYQFGTPDAFSTFFASRIATINEPYVDGVSLTHGKPRQHIWTFANALDETVDNGFGEKCPCILNSNDIFNYNEVIPPFVGQDYFCDTGSSQTVQFGVFYSEDPLWEGTGCGGNSICCEFNNPPWFCKQLPQPTTDDIELRLCSDQDELDENTYIEMVEIYVK